MTVYTMVYLITEVFYIYILNLYFSSVFEERRTNAWALAATYLGFLLIADGEYLILNDFRLNALLNILFMFAITLHYESTMIKRMLTVLLLYIIMAMIESVIVVLTGPMAEISRAEYQEVLGPVFIKFALYIVVLLLRNFKNIRKNMIFPKTLLLSIFLIPCSSVYLIFSMIVNNFNHFDKVQLVICISAILLINVVAFYLYDTIVRYYNERMETELVKQEKLYYLKQFEYLKDNVEEVKAFRHDLRNHLGVLYAMVDTQPEEAKKYITEMNGSMTAGNLYARTGNIIIDSIVNTKLAKAKENNVEIITNFTVPSEVAVESSDLVAVLGNMLDNALNASLKLKEGRKIEVQIRFERGMLRIDISNAFDGNLKYENNHLVTTARRKDGHGYGIRNIENAVRKYRGCYEVSCSESIFCASAIMYVT